MRRAGVRRLTIGSMLLGLAAGCTGDDEDGTADGTTSDGATTVSSTSSSTTEPETSTSEGAGLPDEPPVLNSSSSGSGECSPGPGDLPTGWWYGSIQGASDDELLFDLACYYVGDAAEAEAAERGDEVSNDYYVVNDSLRTRVVSVASDATASCVEVGSEELNAECSPDEVAGDWAVWLRVQAGEVARIVEQYAP